VLVVNDALWIALMRAASAGDVRAVRQLAEDGVEVNAQSPNGTTPIIAATKNGQADTVFELLDLGADPTVPDADGMDAVAWAERRNQSTILEAFRSRGLWPACGAEQR
jgi:ankyrin repeat protein